MKIYIGADHGGFELKSELIKYLQKSGYNVEDEGDKKLDPDDDFPQFAARVASKIFASDDPDPRGLLICRNGQGICMAANRFKGIRAALGWNVEAARSSRNDDDSNVLCLPGDVFNDKKAESIVHIWLQTPFAAATRFIRRNRQLDELA